MKYLVTILILFIWIVCFSSSGYLQRIHLEKYNIVKPEIKRNKVSKVKSFEKPYNELTLTFTYDSLGRIQSKYYSNDERLTYNYQKSKDTLTRFEYESKGEQDNHLIRIEKYIYNQFSLVNEYYSLHEEQNQIFGNNKNNYDTVVFVERDLIEYNSRFQISKIKHFTKSISKIDMLSVPFFPIDSLIYVSFDSVIYDVKGRIKAKFNIDKKKEIRISNKTKFDTKARLKYDYTTWHNSLYVYGKGGADIYYKRIYNYENDKSVCITIDGDSHGGRKEQRKSIETTYYDKRGMESMITSFRDNDKIGDTLVFYYEYYN